jgi:hypothetical protein
MSLDIWWHQVVWLFVRAPTIANLGLEVAICAEYLHCATSVRMEGDQDTLQSKWTLRVNTMKLCTQVSHAQE